MDSRLLTHLLILGFGSGAWVAVNGVWMELPLLVNILPEYWGLPSYMTIILTLGNIGPIAVTLTQAFCQKNYHQNGVIYTILSMAVIACFLLCFIWQYTAPVAGSEHSVLFFILWFILSFVDCTSSVTFLPYMDLFQNLFLTTYFTGEGLGSLFPSVLALIQGVGKVKECVNFTDKNSNQTILAPTYYKPRFSVEVFFGLLTIMMLLCSASFLMLNKLKLTQCFKRIKTPKTTYYSQAQCELSSNDTNTTSDNENQNTENVPLQMQAITNKSAAVNRNTLTMFDYIIFYIIIFWVNYLTNGVMPSVSSYTAMPYGETAYQVTLALGNIANPCACFIAFFRPQKSKQALSMSSIVGTGFGLYLFILALQSPCPVLVSTTVGSILLVFSQVMFMGILSYVKVCVGRVFHERGSKRCLVWYGATVQAGSLVGAVNMFVLVNVLGVFKQGNVCMDMCMQ